MFESLVWSSLLVPSADQRGCCPENPVPRSSELVWLQAAKKKRTPQAEALDHQIEYQQSSNYLTADQQCEQYAKIYHMSHILCITVKIDTPLKQSHLPLMQTALQSVQIVGSCVNCGMIRLPNLEKCHCGMKVCKTA